MPGMELYTAGTSNGQRAAIAVNECGVPCTIYVLNLGQGDQKKPDYLKINPTGRIPPRPPPRRTPPAQPEEKADHGHPVLGDPDVSVREDRQIPAVRSGGAGP